MQSVQLIDPIPRFGELEACYRIRYSHGDGSCFSARLNGSQFFVTAKHLLSGCAVGDHVHFFHGNEWWSQSVRDVQFCSFPFDVAIFRCEGALTNAESFSIEVENFCGNVILGARLIYMGFPLGLFSTIPSFAMPNSPEELPRGDKHLPFLKTARLSGNRKNQGVSEYYLESINNMGFSGGPVLVNVKRDGVVRPEIFGVVTRYHFDRPLEVQKRDDQEGFQSVPDYIVRPNSGFMVAHSFAEAMRSLGMDLG